MPSLGGLTFSWSQGRPEPVADRAQVVQSAAGAVGVVRTIGRADSPRPIRFQVLAASAASTGARALRGQTVACVVPGFSGQVVVDEVTETMTPIVPMGGNAYLITVDATVTAVA